MRTDLVLDALEQALHDRLVQDGSDPSGWTVAWLRGC
jgi:hypothetical protein